MKPFKNGGMSGWDYQRAHFFPMRDFAYDAQYLRASANSCKKRAFRAFLSKEWKGRATRRILAHFRATRDRLPMEAFKPRLSA